MYRYEDLPALMTRMTGDEKHAPSAASTMDVLRTLYFGRRALRRCGVAEEHDAAHGLDVAGLRSSIDGFLRENG